MPPPREESPKRALLAALSAMAGVALLVGLAVGGVILSIVKLAGVGGDAGASEQAPDSLVIPEYSPTEPAEEDLGLPSVTPTSPSPSPSPSASRTKRPQVRQPIMLRVSPSRVATGQRIDLRGSYPDGAGSVLQVQRKEGGAWVDFPVSFSVGTDSFTTYITTSRTGKALLRVVDKAADKASNPVSVVVG
jgi:hypothetical protein